MIFFSPCPYLTGKDKEEKESSAKHRMFLTIKQDEKTVQGENEGKGRNMPVKLRKSWFCFLFFSPPAVAGWNFFLRLQWGNLFLHRL